MKNISKIFLILKLLIINIVISLLVLIIALWTTFPYLHVDSKNNKTLLNHKADTENLYPVFRYDRYDIELDEKAEIDLIVSPETSTVKVEVVGAESIGLGIDSSELLKKGLKIIKPIRPRNKPSKREEISEERIFRTKLIYNLKRIENKSYLVKEKDYKVFKIAVKGILPAAYTLRASTTDGMSATTVILTQPEFRIDSISPSILDIGEGIVTVEGRNLDSLTKVNLGNDIEIKDIQDFPDGHMKVYVYIAEGASRGFRNVTVTNLLTDSSATLVNGLYIGPQIGQDGKNGKDGVAGKDGAVGSQGVPGVDGMSICTNATDTLMVFANNLPPGSQATSFFDPVLCNLTVGIPIGFNGVNAGSGPKGDKGVTGETGTTGTSGLNSLITSIEEPKGSNCSKGGIKVQTGIDLNSNNVLDSSEITTTNYVCNDSNGNNGNN